MPISKILSNWKNNVFDAVYWLEGEETFYIDQLVQYAEHKLLPVIICVLHIVPTDLYKKSLPPPANRLRRRHYFSNWIKFWK